MSSVIHSLKRDESIYNKQLLIIDSENRSINETETSFTNKFDTSNRIVKLEILDCNIPNTLYNVNNDNAIMNIDVSLLNGNIINNKLVVSDDEIKNNIIIDTNIINGSIIKHNFITSAFLEMTNIKTTGLNIYSLGSFGMELVSFYNTDNINPVSNLIETVQSNNIFLACYNIDQTFKWRFKISGDLSNSEMDLGDEKIYIYGKTSTDIYIYDINDNIINTLIRPNQSTNYTFIIEYDIDGNYLYSYFIEDNKIDKVILFIYDGYTYITSICQNAIVFYNYDNSIAYTENGVFSNDGYIAVYKGGNFVKNIIITANNGVLSIDSLSIQESRVFVSFSFNDVINFNGVDSPERVTSNGIKNICITEYYFDKTTELLGYKGRIKIGGSDSDNNSIITTNEKYLFVIGNFTSNPSVFYKSNDTVDEYLQNNLLNNKNIFVAKYPLDFIENVKSAEYTFYLTSTVYTQPSNIKLNSNNFYISSNFSTNMKFYDINGYINANDINNLTTADISQFIVSYTLDGTFIERIYNNNSNYKNPIDVNSNKLITVGSFTLNNSYYNTQNGVDLVVNQKDSVNGIITSYTNSFTGYTLNYDILNNTIIFKDLVADEIGYFLNINSFAEQLGFDTSQKFIPSIFGNMINWNTVKIDSINNKLNFTFKISNLDNKNFEQHYISLIIPESRYANYTPYNLVYELNNLFNTVKNNTSYLNQTFDAFYYNKEKNIFYIRVDINGSFSITDTNLSNINGMNLKLLPYISPLCVISDNIVGDVDNEIVDNSKLTLKLRDTIDTEVVNEVSFNEAFPGVKSSSLIISSENSGDVINIKATTGQATDDLSNINNGDLLEFKTPLEIRGPNSSSSIYKWKSVDMSLDGKYQSAVVSDGFIYISNDYGNSWKKININNDWMDIAVSGIGKYQTAVAINSSIYISYDFGNTWNTVDSVRNWKSVAMSKSGEIQTALATTDTYNGLSMIGGIFQSYDYGKSWILSEGTVNIKWEDISITYDGSYQTAVASPGNMWNYSIENNEWVINTFFISDKNWTSISMSSDGDYQIALGDYELYGSNDKGQTWSNISVPVPEQPNLNDTAISEDGKIQIVADRGYGLFISNNYGNDWGTLNFGGEKVSISENAIFITTVSPNGYIRISSDSGSTSTRINIPGVSFNEWREIRISDDGKYQTATDRFYIYISDDYGVNWGVSPSVISGMRGISVSGDGKYQLGVKIISTIQGTIYKSDNFGNVWNYISNIALSNQKSDTAISSNGEYQILVNGININISDDFGNTWNNVHTTGLWSSCDISSDGLYMVATKNNIIAYSSDSGSNWNEIVPTASVINSITISGNGKYQSICGSDDYIYTSENFGITWNKSTFIEKCISVSMSNSGQYQLSVSSYILGQGYKYFLQESSDYGNTWNEFDNAREWASSDISGDGNVYAGCVYNGGIYINLFGTKSIMLIVKNISNNLITFNEKPTTENRYTLLNNFNMSNGYEFTIKSSVNAPVEDLFITSGNYTIPEFVEQLNIQIHNINTNFYYNTNIEPFTYDINTKKITFNPAYPGPERDILLITNLLKTMGFIELPDNILEPIEGQNTVNKNLSGSNNLYIKSDIIATFMKESNVSTNINNKSVIATLNYDSFDDSYRIVDSNKNEIFLSQKISLDKIDIKVINEKSEIVNLNGGRVSINIKLLKA